MTGKSEAAMDGTANFSDRASAEPYIGRYYSPRIYQTVRNVSRGIVHVPRGDGFLACAAYCINGGTYAQGVLYNRVTGVPTMLLAPETPLYTQSELLEAIDYWERDNDNQLFCLREKSCGAVVFTDSGTERRYLMIRMNLGHCGLPKGHIEKYETEEETAKREVFEETGVSVTLIPGFCGRVEYAISAKTRKESVYFIGRFDDQTIKIQESEIRGYKLIPYEEARTFITHDNDRAVFDNAVAWLNTHLPFDGT